uniref:Uncharacterized protein n=1 Tax=Rangifer tarandus platyrhynchus TaxID=3082113 RepID=A0ACB0EZL0_RANTA|nr:unnamed protein product [Rangifer tarandus platyrhynchus]
MHTIRKHRKAGKSAIGIFIQNQATQSLVPIPEPGTKTQTAPRRLLTIRNQRPNCGPCFHSALDSVPTSILPALRPSAIVFIPLHLILPCHSLLPQCPCNPRCTPYCLWTTLRNCGSHNDAKRLTSFQQSLRNQVQAPSLAFTAIQNLALIFSPTTLLHTTNTPVKGKRAQCPASQAWAPASWASVAALPAEPSLPGTGEAAAKANGLSHDPSSQGEGSLI